MALPTHRYSYQQQQQQVADSIGASLDAKVYSFNDENASSILDSAVLEPEMMHNPSMAHYRKDSFANTDGMLSPADTHVWESQYHDPRPFKAEGTPYMGPIQPHQHIDLSHTSMPNHWAMAPASGSGTPNTTLEMMPPPSQFDNMRHVQAKPVDYDQRYMTGPQGVAGSSTEWMQLAQTEVEQRQLSKRLRSNSPPRALFDIRRDAGIQKKNKRIEIPQERNIQTIDQMIEDTKDEDLLKELKAQKRLLRNREAALASRQRKKKHTEDLESKEKGHQSQVTVLEAQLDACSAEREALDQQRQILMVREQEAQRYIEALQLERRDMVMKHNEETASLRRKVQVLTEQLESMPPSMSAAPSSNGFTDFNAEMEALHMGHDWDNFLFMPGPHTDDGNTEHGHPTPRTDVIKSSAAKDKSVDQPVTSGLLFMLLLCGAFVASKPASTVSVAIPPMPADVRAAAPAILSNLLSESGTNMHPPQMGVHSPSPMQAVMPSRAGNRLTQMHRSLTAPTFQQKVDHAFSLTTSQYASLTNADMMQDHPSPLPPRRTLAQALAESRLPAENKADIYTRSLLWDQIPTDVVNQFKELVRDHHELTKQDGHQQSVYHEHI